MKIITGLSQSNLFLETIRNSIDSQTANLSTESNLSLTDSVLKLMKEVKSRGDDAIKEITLDLDNVKLETIEGVQGKVTAATCRVAIIYIPKWRQIGSPYCSSTTTN